MKRFRLLSLTLLAVFALAAVLSAPASALPELLPVNTGGSMWTGKNTEANPTLETLKKESIVCKEEALDGVQETDTLGMYHTHLSGCKGFGFASCNTEGDSAGVILVLGEYHLVYDHLSVNVNELGVAILFTAKIQIKCTALASIKVEGKLLCLILEPLSSKVTHECQAKQASAGMSETTHWWNDSGTEQTAVLLASKNGGAFEEAAKVFRISFTFPFTISIMYG